MRIMKLSQSKIVSTLLLFLQIQFQTNIRLVNGYTLPIDPATFLLQLSSATIAYVGCIGYFDRPKGQLNLDSSVYEIKSSQIPNAGLGLYVTQDLTEGTILGSYQGVVRPLSSQLSKLMNFPECEAYIWRFSDNSKIIDPTDSKGKIQFDCFGGSDQTPFSPFLMKTVFQSMSVPTTLTRINEPARGICNGCNVRVVEDLKNEKVVFELSRDVFKGEELFMDYGLTYDRSRYAPVSKEEEYAE